MSWNNKLWGVEFLTRVGPVLIGSLWESSIKRADVYPGEPRRALLFCTREQARAWCAKQNAKYADRNKQDVCHSWRFRPVRVRETVRKI